jgi:hypothetical protein
VITRRVGLVALKVRYDARLRLKIKRPWDVRVRKVDEKLPKGIETWSLTSLQQRLVKTGGRLVKHARYYRLLLAEGHLTWRLFGSMLRRLEALPLPAG